MIFDLRRGPPTTRSTDSSSATPVISVPFSRAVSSAASLMTLARSAPDMPTVRFAICSKSTSGANGLPLECTLRIARRPARSGAQTGAALAADRVDLVDEDDAGGVLLGLLEQVAHTRGADADEHLDEVGT